MFEPLTREQVKEIGQKNGLKGRKLQDFTEYTMKREFNLSGTEGYITEWAERFDRDIEFVKSDFMGQGLLKQINPNKY